MPTSSSTLRNRLLARARLRHLHLFVKIAELQSVKRAAEAVGITQPSATQALADLEDLLSLTLFLRHAQGMSLTAAGEGLLPLARRIIELVENTATTAAALASGSQAVVRVAAIAAAVGGGLGQALHAFAQTHPEVLVELQEADAMRQKELLGAGEVDCAICRTPAVVPSGWVFHPLWPDRFAIVASPAHPLAGREDVRMADLLAATWLVMPSPIAARLAFDRLFEGQPGTPATFNVVTTSSNLLWDLVERQGLLTLAPLSVVRQLLASGRLREVCSPHQEPLGDLGLLAPLEVRSSALQRFIDFLNDTVPRASG